MAETRSRLEKAVSNNRIHRGMFDAALEEAAQKLRDTVLPRFLQDPETQVSEDL